LTAKKNSPLEYPEDMKYEPGTRGHMLAFGSDPNSGDGDGQVMTFDLDENMGVINLRPLDQPTAEEADES
jgi:hypothetical protein